MWNNEKGTYMMVINVENRWRALTLLEGMASMLPPRTQRVGTNLSKIRVHGDEGEESVK